ncbi:MAG: hypothetical protein OXP71_13695 [Candidatus Poribacteria bacterium]|nr:hypothetical protein [Candidatus Poribacteria bacterium]
MNFLFRQFCIRLARKFYSRTLVAILFITWAGAQNAAAAWIKDLNQNTPVCTAKNDQYFPNLTSDGAGGVIVVWQDTRHGNQDVFAQRVSAEGEMLWMENGVAICGLPSHQSWPLIITDQTGGAIIIFRDSRHGNQDVYAQRISADGQLLWDEGGVPVCVDRSFQDDVDAIPNGSGGAIIVWEDWRHGNQDIYAQCIDGNGKSVWTQNGVPVNRSEGHQYDCVLTADGSGGAIFAWWNLTPDWNVFAQRLNAKGETVWDAEGIPVCVAPGNQGAPLIVADNEGGAFFVWSDYRNAPSPFSISADLFAQRINAEGNVLWETDGISVCNQPSNQQQPAGVSDGAGGLIVAWWDERDIFSDIYAQRVSPEGVMMWEMNGIPVCAAGGEQRNPGCVPDGSQGAVVYWLDYREDFGNTTADAIYAQRIDPNGKSLWPLNGIPICTADGNQITPQASPDGQGGAFIIWSDGRTDEPDIYIHRAP